VRIDELIWDEWNVEHIAGHNVEPEEVEEICYGRHLARRAGSGKYGQTRYRVYGQTHAGRYLFIVLDRREGNEGSFYVVTARDMTEAEKNNYRKRWKQWRSPGRKRSKRKN